MRDENCIFCKIAAGEIPSRTLFENEDFKVIAPAITNEESEPEPSESSPVTLSSGNINLKITGKIDLSKFDRPKKEIVNNKKNY